MRRATHAPQGAWMVYQRGRAGATWRTNQHTFNAAQTDGAAGRNARSMAFRHWSSGMSKAGDRCGPEASMRITDDLSSGTRTSSRSPGPSLALDSDAFVRCSSYGQPTRLTYTSPFPSRLPVLNHRRLLRVLSPYAPLCTPQTCISFIFANI